MPTSTGLRLHFAWAVVIFLYITPVKNQDYGEQSSFDYSNEVPRQGKIWVYVGIASHFPGGEIQLKHWLHHYLDVLGLPAETALITVNHAIRSAASDATLSAIDSLLHARGINYTLWETEFSDCRHYGVYTALFKRAGVAPEDWMVLTDADEFHEYPVNGSIIPFLDQLDREGYNVVLGHFVDRVASHGALPPIRADVPISEQFPLKCEVVKSLTKGYNGKVLAARGYWRTYTGFHYLLTRKEHWLPRLDTCTSFDLTPYAWWPDCYNKTVVNRPGLPCGSGKFLYKKYPQELKVYHYKWHRGVIASARRRMEHYRAIGISWWSESQRLLDHITANHNRLNVSALNCTPAG